MSLSRKQAIIVGVILTIIALLSPFVFNIHTDMYETTITIYTLFWMIYTNLSDTLVIRFNGFWSTMGYIPFVVFRLGVPIQFVRYYEMKVSGFTLAITGLAGEIPPLIMVLGMAPGLSFSSIVFPLPFHLLICAIVLLLKPVKYDDNVFGEYERLYSYDDTS
ncbi:MAG: hypothetical protein ACTSWA_11905 [Candidatus Thorarchaeota archaeon]